MSFVVFFIPVLLAIMVGLGFLQAYLSKREGAVPGLIIPFSFFLLSLMWVLAMHMGGVEAVECWLALILANIPTYIYLAIYFVCREKYRKKNQMDKMNIQDLD